MRSYDVAVASLAIGAPTKWTDNVIAHNALPGVMKIQRGVARRISHTALLQLVIARQLQTAMGMSAHDAVRIGLALVESGVVHHGPISISIDLAALERQLAPRIAHALESAPTRPRGRPPKRS